MKQNHRDVFFRVAEELNIWIGLREPNPLADDWIDYTWTQPKMADCKAKTSDNPSFDCAGLVVNPLLVPQAFKPESKRSAEFVWKNKFAKYGNHIDELPSGFEYWRATDREPYGEGIWHGVIAYRGKPIFADYDIMTVVPINESGGFEFTNGFIVNTFKTTSTPIGEFSIGWLADNFNRIRIRLNFYLGKEMIQHGPEFDYGGLGARETEVVCWFGPGRNYHEDTSSFVSGGH